MTTVPLEYIEIDDRGVARIIGTRFKVRLLAGAMLAEKLTPDGLKEAFPHLRMDQIHAALAYYYAHQDEIERELEDGARYADEMRAKNPNRFTRAEAEARWRERCPGRPLPASDPDAGGD